AVDLEDLAEAPVLGARLDAGRVAEVLLGHHRVRVGLGRAHQPRGEPERAQAVVVTDGVDLADHVEPRTRVCPSRGIRDEEQKKDEGCCESGSAPQSAHTASVPRWSPYGACPTPGRASTNR